MGRTVSPAASPAPASPRPVIDLLHRLFYFTRSQEFSTTDPAPAGMKSSSNDLYDAALRYLRQQEWEVAFDATIKHPFLGLGLGSEHPPVPGFESLKQHTVHNAFIMLWMKMGIFAVIFLLWGLVRYLKFGLNVLRPQEDLIVPLL